MRVMAGAAYQEGIRHQGGTTGTLRAVSEALRQIERLRGWRARREWDTAIGTLIAEKVTYARRAERRLASLVDLWESLVPAEIAAHTRVSGVRGGTAHVTVDSSSTGYELDRRLREGLEQQLRRAYRGTLVRVRITVGPL